MGAEVFRDSDQTPHDAEVFRLCAEINHCQAMAVKEKDLKKRQILLDQCALLYKNKNTLLLARIHQSVTNTTEGMITFKNSEKFDADALKEKEE